MIRHSFFTLLIMIPGLLVGQSVYEKYTWNTFPAEPRHDTVKSVNGALILLDRDIKEIYLNKDDIFAEIMVWHRKTRVETSTAVSQNNKIFIPTGDALEIISIRARFISPGGKITEVPKESIRQVENLENKGDYRSFAIEGAEAGGQIEYFFVLRKKFNPFGTVVKQDDRPRANVDVICRYPSKIEFIFKSYNGFPAFSQKTDSSGITEQRAMANYIPGLEAEKYAFYDANLQRYEYTMAYNHYTSPVRTYSWSKIAERFHELFYEPSKKETAAVKDYLESMNLNLKDREPAILEIERRVKTGIPVVSSADANMTLDQVIRAKKARKRDIVNLFATIYREAGIKYDLCVTTDKEERRFDPDFNGWNFMDEFLLFFPESGKYIVPAEETQRYGLLPPSWQENYGMFFQPVSYGDKLKTLGFETRYMAAVPSDEVTDSLLINLQADPAKMSLTAITHRVFSKEMARNFQAWWSLWEEERRKEIVKEIFNMGDADIRIKSYALHHNTPADIGVFPLTWDVTAVSDALMESAGEDILVKIGESIGPQSELYQTGPRRFPVEISMLHSYYRRIELQIPEGYHPGDLSSLNMNVIMMYKGKPGCYFKSEATLRGNLLIVTSEEKYSDTYYPKEKFEEFRSVINAAADFNKRTVLLTKNTP